MHITMISLNVIVNVLALKLLNQKGMKCNLERLPMWPNSINVEGAEFERTSKFNPANNYSDRYR